MVRWSLAATKQWSDQESRAVRETERRCSAVTRVTELMYAGQTAGAFAVLTGRPAEDVATWRTRNLAEQAPPVFCCSTAGIRTSASGNTERRCARTPALPV